MSDELQAEPITAQDIADALQLLREAGDDLALIALAEEPGSDRPARPLDAGPGALPAL